ncbi:putative nuclease HARBI1 [Heptranchias perlo]|uniref:putative nuclease HARBI1 n=1 Tax=Heptranchias perlo TaxID=212740 RepID=UPI0035593D08
MGAAVVAVMTSSEDEQHHQPCRPRRPPLTRGAPQHGAVTHPPAQQEGGQPQREMRRRRHYPRHRVYRPRLSFLDLSEEQCIWRLRVSRQVVADICSLLNDELFPDGPSIIFLPFTVKVTTALNFFASGSFQGATGDITGVSQSSARKCIRQVTNGLFHRASHYINFPMDDRSQMERAVGFHAVAGFPRVQGIIDYTHIAIRAPPREPGLFVNRKGYHSMNTQLICNHRKRFLHVCTRYPGNCHDSFIHRESTVPPPCTNPTPARAGSSGTRDIPCTHGL